ncbi:MAG: hypothetical protein JSS83_16480, partial [Cyanobacteria bacterium SZAS LIN-3]|nr:hypothetical protein [Cyanobacteria bacterium SZAS LIN-3]
LDSQREELGAKYEQDQAGKSRRMKVVAAFACLALILAVVAGFNVYSVANRKVVPVAVTPDSAIPSYKDYEKRPLVESAAVVADEKILAQTKSIKSDVDAASNTKTFHCPPVALGNFIWERGFKSIAGIDVDPRDDGKVVARGDCQVPADRPLCLSIEVNQNRAVFHAPEILAKFGPDDISALMIAAPAPPEEMEEDAIRIPVRNRINTLVEQLVGWTNLRYFEFYNLVATHRALDLLDKHDTLRVFVGHVASVDAKYLAQKRFMRRLVSLELNSVNDLDSALIGLKGSQAIKNIFLANSELSVRGVDALASCPNLLVLSMDNMDMDNAAVGALGNIKSLRRLKLSRQYFRKEDFPVLLKLKDIECVDLDLSKWSKFDRDRLFALMPCADPVARRRLMRARSAALSP